MAFHADVFGRQVMHLFDFTAVLASASVVEHDYVAEFAWSPPAGFQVRATPLLLQQLVRLLRKSLDFWSHVANQF